MSASRSSGRAKKVDYAALQEIKIEEVEEEDEVETVEIVVPRVKKRKQEDLDSNATELITEGKCGKCKGCSRKPCMECSFCKSGDNSQCIDLYCVNDKEGRSQRQAAREAYLLSLGKARLPKVKSSDSNEEVDDEFDHDDEGPAGEIDFTQNKNLTVQEQIDMIMEQIGAAQKKRRIGDSPSEEKPIRPPKPKEPKPRKTPRPEDGTKAPRHHIGIYGGSSKAAKTRRCGECEGCMRDDCGACPACADKPRFGGPGTKKKACIMRYCRTRKLEEDHAQANFPLNSADALKGPRPTSTLKMGTNSVGKVDDEEAEVEDAILQD